MKPALTSEEWAAGDGHGPLWALHQGYTSQEIAALCLHGQLFGFTREDVAALQIGASILEIEWGSDLDEGVTSPTKLRDLASRIEALLPPKDA